MTSSADQRGWGPGWPADRRPDMVKVTDGNDVTVYVHRAVARLIAGLLQLTERMGYALHGGECWGYANRPIRGTQTPSNHSWGLAVDANASENPMGAQLVTDIPVPVRETWKRFGFRWGGDYSGRKDAMHFEFVGNPVDAVRLTDAFYAEFGATLGQPPAPPPVVPQPPARRPYPGRLVELGSKGDDVRWVQQHVGATVDGDFGPHTKAAVQRFQRAHGLDVDGIVGPRTWAALGA